jgi:uncharacterized repeat protein (TIGR03803 family)
MTMRQKSTDCNSISKAFSPTGIIACAAVTAALAVILFLPVTAPAQNTAVISVLHTFSAPAGPQISEGGGTNYDGAQSMGGLVLSGGTLFGTTYYGGTAGYGTVFRINIDGTCFTNLHNFTNGLDGGNCGAAVILSGSTLYGVARSGGSSNFGTVFSLQTDGTGFTTLYSFTNGVDGQGPLNALMLSDGILYGNTSILEPDPGTLFELATNGNGFTVLHTFGTSWTTPDGFAPNGPLILSCGTLYGTAFDAGTNGGGTLYSLTAEGANFTTLYPFGYAVGGHYPVGGVVLSGGMLYGITSEGGSNDCGTVYSVDTNGDNFSAIYNFTNNEGENGGGATTLTELGGTLFGPTLSSIFEIETNGMGFANVYTFSPLTLDTNYLGTNYDGPGANTGTNYEGYVPNGPLVFSNGVFYGTTQRGGVTECGTVFALYVGSPPVIPSPEIQMAGGSVVLTWANPNFSLQAAPSLSGAFTNVPGASSPFTNANTASQMFYRLTAR